MVFKHLLAHQGGKKSRNFFQIGYIVRMQIFGPVKQGSYAKSFRSHNVLTNVKTKNHCPHLLPCCSEWYTKGVF